MLQGDNETSFALFWTKVVLLFYLGNITFLKSIKYLILKIKNSKYNIILQEHHMLKQ